MAEKRKPGFNIPLNFYDGPEVESIPKRIRAAAVGVWALAGNYAATQLSDGYVGPGMLKAIGCTDAIRAALKVTINKKGELSPLWIDARNGGVQLTNWTKHQRTNDEVTAYRHTEAERKRIERETKRNGSTSENRQTSGRTTAGHSADVRSDAGDPKTETETEIKNSGHLTESATDSNGRGSVAATPGADLVRAVIPKNHPAAVQTGLRMQASALINAGTPPATVEAALRLWLTKSGVGPGVLPSLVSDVIKSESPRPHTNGLTPGEAKVIGWAQLGKPIHADQEAIER